MDNVEDYSLVSVLRMCSWQGSVCCFLLSRILLTESSRPNTWARLLSTATSTRQESGISAAINHRVTWSVRKEEKIQLLHSFTRCCDRSRAKSPDLVSQTTEFVLAFHSLLRRRLLSECPAAAGRCWCSSVPVSCRATGSFLCCTLLSSACSSVLMLVTTSPSRPTSAMPFQKFSVSSADMPGKSQGCVCLFQCACTCVISLCQT